MTVVRLGIEQLLREPPTFLAGKRLGLRSNQASVGQRLRTSRELVAAAFPGQLTTLFAPQHGFFSEKQDNMVESDHFTDPVTGCRGFSLYGEVRKPRPRMFADIDVLLVDLVDVGTRVYTFAWTVLFCLETAAETDVQVLVLDRPNPLGGIDMEGNLLQSDQTSFVGLHPIPMRHGLTLGELALLCNREREIGARLSVVPVKGWRRRMLFPETGSPWVFPSPNMPSWQTALVYPGQVLWEGTNVSEGRGTTLPFELLGAPFIDPWELVANLPASATRGCFLRPLFFEPTSGKWAGQSCGGVQIHVTAPDRFLPLLTGLSLLQAVMTLYPEDFSYKDPPYEYAFHRLPLDLILGDRQVRLALEAGIPPAELARGWQEDLVAYRRRCQAVFLYD